MKKKIMVSQPMIVLDCGTKFYTPNLYKFLKENG